MVYVYAYSRCCASTCTNTSRNSSSRGVKFCRIPKDKRGKIWLERAGRHDLSHLDPAVAYAKRLCSDHFDSSQFMTLQRKRLVWNALPTIFRRVEKEEGSENQEVTIRKSPVSPDGSSEFAEEVIVLCFVCSRIIYPGFSVCLNTPSEATKVILQRLLESVLNWTGGVAAHEVVCRRCSSLLNHIDRTEKELNVLKGAISTCVMAKGKDPESEPKLKNCENILDRFSRGLGERQYVIPLEDIFPIKGKKDSDLELNAVESVEVGDALHDSVQHSGENIAAVFTNNGLNARKQVNVGVAKEIRNVGCNGEEAAVKKQNLGVDKATSDVCSNEEGVTTVHMVKNGSSQLGYLDKPLETQHMKNKCRSCSPKICCPAGESKRDSLVEVGEESSSVNVEHGASLDSRPKTNVCQVCSFETVNQSVMIWHLRQHMRKGRWCDYCSVELPEQGSPLAHSEVTRLHSESSACLGSNHEPPDLIGSDAPDYPVVEVSSCTMRFYKNVCKICPFKTDHDSVMIYHLRLHMKSSWHCDYCSENIPKYRPPRWRRDKLKRKSVSKKTKIEGSTVSRMNEEAVGIMETEENCSTDTRIEGIKNGVPVFILPAVDASPVTAPAVHDLSMALVLTNGCIPSGSEMALSHVKGMKGTHVSGLPAVVFTTENGVEKSLSKTLKSREKYYKCNKWST